MVKTTTGTVSLGSQQLKKPWLTDAGRCSNRDLTRSQQQLLHVEDDKLTADRHWLQRSRLEWTINSNDRYVRHC